MSSVKSLLFSHNHHLLSVKGCEAGLDVLAFEGDEALSQPFRYRIEFTSADHAISKEMMLMKAASLTLQAPVAQGFGINVQQPVRVIQGVVTGFERLSTSRDETHYALTLSRAWRCLTARTRTPFTRTSPFRRLWKKSSASATACAVRIFCSR
jgi:type VI secretion system secreted protein VgrG